MIKFNPWGFSYLLLQRIFPGHRFETHIHIQIRLNTILALATLFKPLINHFMFINKSNLSLHLKVFSKNLVSSWCLRSFFHRCPINSRFLFYIGHFSLRWLPLTAKIFQISPDPSKKFLTRFKGNFRLKLPCGVILLFLPNQCDIPSLF